MTTSACTVTCAAVLFDLDGTLVHSGPAIERAWRSWADRHGLDPEIVLAASVGRRTAETIALVAPHLDGEREAVVLEAGEAADTADVVPAPGAHELVQRVSSGPWAVVTSGTRAVATARLRTTGIRVPSVLVTADDVTAGKPEPEGYLLAAAALGVAPGACLVIEDAWPGVLAARHAGMAVIGVAGPGLGDVQPDVVVPDLTRLVVRRSSEGMTVTCLR
jgi:sugar-phosphatase